MPLYELTMVCRMGESNALSSLLKAVSTTVLQEGGVVRGYRNLGDRVMPKNLRSVDGISHGVGRYIQVEYYGSPGTQRLAEVQARQNSEVLRLFTNKAVSENAYMKRMMLQLNAEVSPFKDDETKDSGFVREILDKYREGE
jgi:ribosomal protein S6